MPRTDAMQRAHEVLYYVGLGEARYRNVDTYSTGMKQRIKLAQALVHDPDLLFLDEPTNGMDPKGRDEMLELDSRHRAQQGHQSHSLVASVCPTSSTRATTSWCSTRARWRPQGPIAALKGHGGRVFELRVKGDDGSVRRALQAAGIECHETDEDMMRVFVPEDCRGSSCSSWPRDTASQVRHLRAERSDARRRVRRAVGQER